MSQRIVIEIVDKVATCLTKKPLVCGNSKYKVEFVFDEEWDVHPIKTAVFNVNGKHIREVFEGNTCKFPVIQNALVATVGVFAGTIDDGTLSTSTSALVKCKPCATDGDAVPAPPQDDVYNQIVGLCGKAVETARGVEERANNGEFDGEDGLTPYIKDGNWWIGETDTGVKAKATEIDAIKNGSAEGSIIINEGIANGESSIAGGTTDTDLIKSILGGGYASLIDKYGSIANMPDFVITLILKAADVDYTVEEFKRMLTVSPSKAEGILSIALGASNKSNTAGSISLGYSNISGAKGYYITAINTTDKTITLSTKQDTTSTPLNTINWNKGDRLFIVNDDRYWVEVSARNGNVITLTDMPFSSLAELKTVSIPLVATYDITNPNERSVVNLDKPESGEVDIGWGAIALGALNVILGSNALGVGYKNLIAGDFGVGFGQKNEVGDGSFATGNGNKARGKCSFASGNLNKATGNYSHAEGADNKATNDCAHAEGSATTASGMWAHSEGRETIASGGVSHAEGNETHATGKNSHAEGYQTQALGENSHAEGILTIAEDIYSHAEGSGSKAQNKGAHAEGFNTVASGTRAHAEGFETTASGDEAHAEGLTTTASGKASHAEGNTTEANGKDSHAEGMLTKASGACAHAEGQGTKALGVNSHAEGHYTEASGEYSHAEGYQTMVNASYGHAEGYQTVVNGKTAHAEGNNTSADGDDSHAEGYKTIASGGMSHAEGDRTNASGSKSHAEGQRSLAKGENAHAEGKDTTAKSINTHAEGFKTIANGAEQHVQGRYNIEDSEKKYAHIVGNGTGDDNRSNAHTLDWKGNAWFAGKLSVSKDGITIGNTTINEEQLKKLLQLIEG